MNDVPRLDIIIPAGGAGTRLWPLSRADRPKFLLDLTGDGRTLLQQTYDRLAPLASSVTVVTGIRHTASVAGQLPALLAENLIAEPSPRDSMAAIGLAAALIWRRKPDSLIGSFAADHLIQDDAAFAAAVKAATRAAQSGYLCTIGIEPDSASTAFGYIETGDPLPSGALSVRRFVEKPDSATAAAYVATGRFRWNAGMFVTRADVLLGHLQEHQPHLYDGVEEIAAAWFGPARAETLARRWPTLTRIAIDHAIAEPVAAEGGVACVPGAFGWMDIGDFSSLSEVLPVEDVRVLGESTLVQAIDASGIVVTGDRAITLLGVRDIVVVDTGDALLITTRADAQRVREAAEAWRGQRSDIV
jgi:mannose-1-phosphate guanylyltransferase